MSLRPAVFAPWLLLFAAAGWAAFAASSADSSTTSLPISTSTDSAKPWSQSIKLDEGESVEIRVGIASPSVLPPNARIGAQWTGPKLEAFSGDRGDLRARSSADWSKTLHALDPDVTLIYRAPATGRYTLAVTPIVDEPQPTPDYHRDDGLAPLATPLPTRTPLPEGTEVEVEVRSIGSLAGEGLLVEAEPNNTPELAMDVPLAAGDSDQVVRVLGGQDELEYFNNASSGKGPDDWFRIVHTGSNPKLLTANLQLVEPTVSARMRFYRQGRPSAEELEPREPPKSGDFGNANPVPYVHPNAEILDGPEPIYTFYDGRDINERLHQQDDNFRSFISRLIQPGETYYLRVESNQPAYELELRLIDGAPFDDPREAVRQSIYYQLAEVDAWLIHRPRNIGIHTRVRDGSSLFGEACMSCHTQSGVWGVADAFRHGYRPDGTIQNQRRLINTMYESLRPTIKLEDGAVNTSLAPNDLGDAPAGSRVAGRNIVLHERTFQPKKLHSYQQRRTANYVLMTADPKGINAAGKGSNFGPNVVFKFAAEILERAWRDTDHPKYFAGIEEKAKKILETGDTNLKVTDDLGHRIEFFHDLFPKKDEYLATVARLSDRDPQRLAAAEDLYEALRQQAKRDLDRLLALQQDNGGWGFDLGLPDGDGWTRMDEEPDAAPTAVALIALRAAGYGPDDEPVKRAVDWLLSAQYPYGLWNKAAQTGFVTNAYVIRALSRLYPGDLEEFQRADFEPKPNETFLAELARVRALEKTARPDFADLMIQAASSPRPLVRRHAYLGLGGSLAEVGVPALIEGLGDPVKSCREAAFWSLRQLLLDDKGWQEAGKALREGDDRSRQSVAQALVTRADLTGPGASIEPAELARWIAAGFSDPHPGVRAYMPKASWRWWVWNPGMRDILNQAWTERLSRPEPNAHAEIALRYSAASMLIVNGQIANQTGGDNIDQQYPELSELYRLLDKQRASLEGEDKRRLDRRLAAVAATHFQERGNDGGPGQMGYSTPGASDTLGDAVRSVYRNETDGEIPWRKIALEGAANINHARLQADLLALLQSGDLEMVAVAAKALSNPQAIELKATPQTLRPMLNTVERFLRDSRREDAEALVNFLSKVRWDFEEVSEEDEREFFRLLTGPRSRAAAQPASFQRSLLGRPAPTPAPEPEPAAFDEQAALLGKILGENRSLQRPQAFDFVASGSPEFWLPSAEWMLAYEQGSLSAEEALEGAVEAEQLPVLELTFGRTTEQIVPDGLASRNTVLWWREGVPGAKLTFGLEAPEAGSYELIAAFLYDREMGMVRFSLNGEELGETWDFYRESLSASGPVSLGVHQLAAGENRLSIDMLGANPDAEPNYVFGLDYIKLEADDGTGSLFSKDESGVDVIDPIVVAKEDVVRMFTRWFSADAPRDIREQAIRLANKTALRRNPEIRKTLADYVDQEPVPQLKTRIQNILNSDDEVYGEQLRKLIDEQSGEKAVEVRPLTSEKVWIDDLLHFRDYVFAELNKISDRDNRACISCHGVPGRVPTLYLVPPDAAGYIAPADLLANYRRMQQRVDLADVEKSKFAMKPLNIQTGEDDGHQGGVRYEPDEPGYKLIRDWVLKQHRLQSEQ